MKRTFKYILSAAALAVTLGLSSCVGDLDVEDNVIDPNKGTNYEVEGLFNKCYANLAMEGNAGGGSTDIIYPDAGFTGLVRQMWNSNELTTDEAICGWGDDGIATFIDNVYDASHPMLAMYYQRLSLGISYCNQYLKVASGYDQTMTAEIRFVRALQYYLLMDGWGNIPFAKDIEKPVQIDRKAAYDWIEKELLEIEPQMSDAKAKKSTDAGYGRADKAAAWFLLMRLYLNAEVYTGTPQWEKAAEYAKKVMTSSYRLNTKGVGAWTPYQMLFMGDNGETDAAYEAVLPLFADGITTTQYGCSEFLIASTFDADMHANPNDPAATNGVNVAWSGNRARPDLVRKFFPIGDVPHKESYETAEVAGDDRALFCGVNREIENTSRGSFTDGFAVAKFTNFKTDGSAGKDPTFADTDFFLFRVAEAYLAYAEATARMSGGNTTAEGTKCINDLRKRAHAQERNSGSFTLNDILDEWSREFYFEGIRRPTLIRFGKFGGNNGYKWQWKGGSFEGRDFAAYRNIFAIPAKDLIANGNLKQNPGYK